MSVTVLELSRSIAIYHALFRNIIYLLENGSMGGAHIPLACFAMGDQLHAPDAQLDEHLAAP